MSPLTPSGHPCGYGGRISTCPNELIAVLQNQTLSMQQIRNSIRYRYCPRTVSKWIGILRKDGVIECVASTDMRKPMYRLVKQ